MFLSNRRSLELLVQKIQWKKAQTCSRTINSSEYLLLVIPTTTAKGQSLDVERTTQENSEGMWSDHYKLVNEKSYMLAQKVGQYQYFFEIRLPFKN